MSTLAPISTFLFTELLSIVTETSLIFHRSKVQISTAHSKIYNFVFLMQKVNNKNNSTAMISFEDLTVFQSFCARSQPGFNKFLFLIWNFFLQIEVFKVLKLLVGPWAKRTQVNLKKKLETKNKNWLRMKKKQNHY